MRMSYLLNEILWGYHFRNCVHYIKQEVGGARVPPATSPPQGVYAVDLSKVGSVRADSTPRLSGALLTEESSARPGSPLRYRGLIFLLMLGW